MGIHQTSNIKITPYTHVCNQIILIKFTCPKEK
jgi:hypothetical protein